MWRSILCVSFIFFYLSVQAKPVEMLFSFSGKTALLQYESKNQYKVTINKLSPHIVYFSDRPIREADLISINDFLNLWYKPNKNSFANIAPNIVLSGQNKQEQITSYVFIMSQPTYNVSQQQLSFAAKLVSKQKLPLLVKLNNITVFVDGYWGMKTG